MADDLLSIPINSIETDFDDFLSPDSNKRIIFSGPFGIGKSYFLDKFFKNRESKFLPIFLRPINYSLLSNEDVFRLIKYDILLQLINVEGFEIENEFDFSEADFNKSFIGENGFLILYNLLKLIPKIKSTIDGIEKLGEILDAYKKGKENLNRHPDIKILFDFQHETQENFLLEYDHVSQFIADKLEEIGKLNDSNNPLKRVLIIDDLDRLDPEHIFRLFNVFSAHFDHVNYYSDGEEVRDNKFGFDKIIFVCDIENIRKIFAHKYGSGVDFTGYIDKFYSTRPYNFLNYSSIKNYIQKDLILKEISIESNYFIQIICLFLMHNKLINLRKIENLFKIHQKHEALRESDLITIKDVSTKSNSIDWIRHLSPLKSLFGSYAELIEILNNSASLIQPSIEFTGLERNFTQAIIVSALHRSIRKNNKEVGRSANMNKSINIDYGSVLIRVDYREYINPDHILLMDFRVEFNLKGSEPVKFSDFKEALISVLTVGLNLKILNE